MSDVNSITFIGRRWFRRGPGNTYHSVVIMIDGEVVHKIPYASGYGDGYIQSGVEWLVANDKLSLKKYPNGGYEPMWQAAQRLGFKFHAECSDVAREKDL